MNDQPKLRLAESAAPTPPSGPTAAEGLSFRGGSTADLLIRGAHAVDPRANIDAVLDVLVRAGEIAEIGPSLSVPADVEVVDATGQHLFPGFVDPHVHL